MRRVMGSARKSGLSQPDGPMMARPMQRFGSAGRAHLQYPYHMTIEHEGAGDGSPATDILCGGPRALLRQHNAAFGNREGRYVRRIVPS